MRALKLSLLTCAIVSGGQDDTQKTEATDLNQALTDEWGTPDGAFHCMKALKIYAEGAGSHPVNFRKRALDVLIEGKPDAADTFKGAKSDQLYKALLEATPPVTHASDTKAQIKKLLTDAGDPLSTFFQHHKQQLLQVSDEARHRPENAMVELFVFQLGTLLDNYENALTQAKNYPIEDANAKFEAFGKKLDDPLAALDTALSSPLFKTLKDDHTAVTNAEPDYKDALKALQDATDAATRTSAYTKAEKASGNLDPLQKKAREDALRLKGLLAEGIAEIDKLNAAQQNDPIAGQMLTAIQTAQNAANQLDKAKQLTDDPLRAISVYRQCYALAPKDFIDLIQAYYDPAKPAKKSGKSDKKDTSKK